jgi:hypothetical protein
MDQKPMFSWELKNKAFTILENNETNKFKM